MTRVGRAAPKEVEWLHGILVESLEPAANDTDFW